MGSLISERNNPTLVKVCTPQQAAALTDGILNMLVTDMRTLSMVEDEGFRQKIHVLNPGYTLPSRTHFTKLEERKCKQIFQAVKSDAVIYTLVQLNHLPFFKTEDLNRFLF